MADAVSVGIITYNRPKKLQLLLAAIDEQQLPDSLEGRVRIILVDNSVTMTALPVAKAYEEKGRFPLEYISETRKGLSTARNAVLNAAMAHSEAVAFIDDDEVPVDGWLSALVETLHKTGAAAAVGPIRPIFEGVAPEWAAEGQYFAKRLEAPDGFVRDGYTCNAIVRTSVLQTLALRFDPEFNQTGGEDTLFFAALMRAGERIAWAEEAVVLEWIPTDRVQVAWLARRWFRTGGTEARLGRFGAMSLEGRGLNLGRGFVRIFAGTAFFVACLPGIWIVPSKIARAVKMTCRGAGLIASALGRDHQEYAHRSYK